ncbi:hypothetical protein [Isachenkonia alkalipeptolytica]|uniref:Uncharacterized protein n=1 Tax=Isachenkonia alkalipeptolytica TaxID=2565777 RepID=A0AA43XKR9_9CLOT|nr:hypothetical protein [Isachenkonia alkalipeptolytica]NBG88653.1 hypothetical protein [Isachenkonia alkalipeptolytica]
MESKQLIIECENGKNIYRLLTERFAEERFFDGPAKSILSGDNLYIIYGEKYYYRNKSRIFATITMHRRADNECRINILLGGGSGGVTVTLGAEKNLMKKIIKRVEEVTEENQWILTEVDEEKEEKEKKKDKEQKSEDENTGKNMGPL